MVVSAFTIDVDTRASQVFTLSVGGVTETVEITETAPAIESSTMTVGSVIDQKTVQEIPLNGRHFVDLGLLIPGTVTPPANGFLTAPLRGQGSFGLNTAGNREDTVNFMINGINLNDPSQNQITFQPSINTVSEFKASNSTFSAEYGHTSGTIANIATRSGSNERVIEQAQTGNPLNYLTANTSFTGNRTLRPNVNGHIEVVGDPSEWINYTPTNQVLVAPSGTFGNLGRNAITGPSFVNTDFSVMKDTKITERFKLQFRVEEFDLFNHPNFGNPNLILPTAQLGSFNQITSTRFPTGDFGSARQMQITLRLMF